MKTCERQLVGTVESIRQATGLNGLAIWNLLNEREACKRYGPKGWHQMTPSQLADVLGRNDLSNVEGEVVTLVGMGVLRYHAATATVSAG